MPIWNRGNPPVNQVADLLVDSRIALEIDVRHRQALLGVAADVLAAGSRLSRDEVLESLAERERLGSTALGLGVALPHARVPGLKEPLAAYLRPEQPLLFDAPDDKPVADFLVLLVPDRADERHLRILAEAAQMFSDPGFRERLRAAASVAEVQAVFGQWKPW